MVKKNAIGQDIDDEGYLIDEQGNRKPGLYKSLIDSHPVDSAELDALLGKMGIFEKSLTGTIQPVISKLPNFPIAHKQPMMIDIEAPSPEGISVGKLLLAMHDLIENKNVHPHTLVYIRVVVGEEWYTVPIHVHEIEIEDDKVIIS